MTTLATPIKHSYNEMKTVTVLVRTAQRMMQDRKRSTGEIRRRHWPSEQHLQYFENVGQILYTQNFICGK